MSVGAKTQRHSTRNIKTQYNNYNEHQIAVQYSKTTTVQTTNNNKKRKLDTIHTITTTNKLSVVIPPNTILHNTTTPKSTTPIQKSTVTTPVRKTSISLNSTQSLTPKSNVPLHATYSIDTNSIVYRSDVYTKKQHITVPTYKPFTIPDTINTTNATKNDSMNDRTMYLNHAAKHHSIKREFVNTLIKLKVIKPKSCPIHKKPADLTQIDITKHNDNSDCTCHTAGLDEESIQYLSKHIPPTESELRQHCNQSVLYNYDSRLTQSGDWIQPDHYICCLSDTHNAATRYPHHITEVPDLISKRPKLRQSKPIVTFTERLNKCFEQSFGPDIDSDVDDTPIPNIRIKKSKIQYPRQTKQSQQIQTKSYTVKQCNEKHIHIIKHSSDSSDYSENDILTPPQTYSRMKSRATSESSLFAPIVNFFTRWSPNTKDSHSDSDDSLGNEYGSTKYQQRVFALHNTSPPVKAY